MLWRQLYSHRDVARYAGELLSGKSVGLNTLEPIDIFLLLRSPPNGTMVGSFPQGATLERDARLVAGFGPRVHSRKTTEFNFLVVLSVEQSSRRKKWSDMAVARPTLSEMPWWCASDADRVIATTKGYSA